MTAPFGRRHRSDTGRRPGLDGDFPGDEAITEVLERVRPADWDGTTITFGGAGIGTMAPAYGNSYDATGRDPEPDPAARVRQAIEQTALAERGTGPRPQLRALPAAPPPGPAIRHDHDTIARDMAHGWAALFEVRCAFPAAAAETPIPCDSVHRDGAALSFRALRASAFTAGWHLDALGRMTCPDCGQASPAYRTLYPITHSHPELRARREAGLTVDNAVARDVLDGVRGCAVPMGDGSHRDAEAWFRGVAEHNLFRDVLNTARHGRHAGGAR